MELMKFMGRSKWRVGHTPDQPIDLPPILRPIAKGAPARIMRTYMPARAGPSDRVSVGRRPSEPFLLTTWATDAATSTELNTDYAMVESAKSAYPQSIIERRVSDARGNP